MPEQIDVNAMKTGDETAADQAEAFARDVASFSRGAWREAALGYLAILRGRRDEAEELLRNADVAMYIGDADVNLLTVERAA